MRTENLLGYPNLIKHTLEFVQDSCKIPKDWSIRDYEGWRTYIHYQETVEHFLLECPLYKEQRSTMRSKVGDGKMRLDVLLGDWQTITEHTAEFIKSTGRLDKKGKAWIEVQDKKTWKQEIMLDIVKHI